MPFLRPGPRDAVLRLIADPARRIEVVITDTFDRFAYRLVERKGAAPVPLLISPAVSPVLGNLPSFLSADVAPNGVIRNLEEHSFVNWHWRDIGGLGTLGVSEFRVRALVNLQRRLEREPELRAKYALLYMGDAPYHEVDERNWRSYWCAATEYSSTAFRDCLAEGGFSFLTRRGVAVVGAAATATIVVLGAVRRRRGGAGSAPAPAASRRALTDCATRILRVWPSSSFVRQAGAAPWVWEPTLGLAGVYWVRTTAPFGSFHGVTRIEHVMNTGTAHRSIFASSDLRRIERRFCRRIRRSFSVGRGRAVAPSTTSTPRSEPFAWVRCDRHRSRAQSAASSAAFDRDFSISNS